MKRLTFATAGLLGVLSLALASYQLGNGHGYEDGSIAAISSYNRGFVHGQDSVVCAQP